MTLHEINQVLLSSKFLLALFCACGHVAVVFLLETVVWMTQNCEKKVTIATDCATSSVWSHTVRFPLQRPLLCLPDFQTLIVFSQSRYSIKVITRLLDCYLNSYFEENNEKSRVKLLLNLSIAEIWIIYTSFRITCIFYNLRVPPKCVKIHCLLIIIRISWVEIKFI